MSSDISDLASDKLYSALIASSDDAIFTKTLTGIITTWNPGAERLYGFRADEAIGRSITIIVPESRRAEIDAILDQIRQGQRVHHFETLRMRKNGQIIDVSITVSPIKGDLNEILGASVIARDITQQKQMQAALDESHQKLNTLFALLPVGISIIDKHRNEAYSNPALHEMLATPSSTEAPAIQQPERATPRSASDLASSQPYDLQLETTNAKGSARWVHVSTTPVRIADWRAIVVATDITENKHAQAALFEREQRLHMLAETMPAIPWSATPDGQVDYFSQRWLEFTGLSEEEAFGNGWQRLSPAEELDGLISAWNHALATGQPFDYAHRVRTASDEYRWQRSRALPEYNDAGQILRWHGITDDIHNLRLAEERLRNSEERLQTILGNLSEGLLVINARGEPIEWNRAALTMHGLQAQKGSLSLKEMRRSFQFCDMDGKVLPPEQWPMLRLSRGESIQNLELQLRQPGQSWNRVFRYNGATVRSTTNAPVRFLTITDITEQKQTEQALEAQRQELQRSNDDLEKFAYIASHDLQEPLRMVASYTELLSERYRGKLDAKADTYISYAIDGARRMRQLILDLLAYSRVGTHGKNPQEVDSAAVLAQVLESLRASINERQATITVEPLPTVCVDPTQLGQVFQNLLGNALKFHRDVPIQITICAEADQNMWRFSVSDNGIGIEHEYAERVFQVFQQLHERGRYPGSGIGLSIAKRIIERLGGGNLA